MAHDQQTYRRGTMAAVIGLLVQLVLAIAAMLGSFWVDNRGWAPGAVAMYAMTWHLFAGVPVWLILIVTYNEHRRERVESLEAAQLAKSDAAAAAIFDEHEDDLNVARRRLANVYKWGINIVAVGVSLFLIVVGFVLLNKGQAALAAPQPDAAPDYGAVLLVLTVVTAFVSFMVARYQAGMTKVREWKLLRAGAGYLMGNAVVAVLLLAASVMIYFGNPGLFRLLALGIPVLLIVLGFEVVVAFMLGFYRPRKPGEMPRPAFDSRLTGWLTSPESLGKIISDTINYQFGWEISKSWFYQLLSRWMVRLIVAGAASLLLLSSFVVVDTGEQAIITHFGRIVGEGENAVKGPGLHVKLPWPMGAAYRFETGRVNEFTVGSVKERLEIETNVLWGTGHGEEEYLVTAPSSAIAESDDDSTQTPGMALIGAEVAVHWRISDLPTYFQSVMGQRDFLRALAEREVNRYFVSHDIDTLIARGRVSAGNELQQAIQAAVNNHNVGVEILYVGLTGLHPPQTEDMAGTGEGGVAQAFLNQIGALQEREAAIERANQTAIETLSAVAGTPEKAVEVHDLIEEYQALTSRLEAARQAEDADAIADAEAALSAKELQIVEKIADSRGEAAGRIFTARADRWELVNQERADALRFSAELIAFRHAPTYYPAKLYLEAVANGMARHHKYIIAAPGSSPPTLQFDQTQQTDALRDVLEAGREQQ